MPDNRTPQNTTPGMGMDNRPGGGAARFLPVEKAKNAKGTLKKLLRFYVKEAKGMFVASALLLLAAAATVLAPYLIGKSVSAMTDGVNFSLVNRFGAALLIIYISVWVLNVIQGLIMNKVTQRIVRTLRRSLFGKLQRLPLMYHDAHPHGELMSRLTNDIDNISGTIAQSTTELISAFIKNI